MKCTLCPSRWLPEDYTDEVLEALYSTICPNCGSPAEEIREIHAANTIA